jgi:ERCC4-type nuclease
MPIEGLFVIADKRERNREIISALEDSGIEVRMETLPCGDYAVSERVCVERKTVSDFESSIVDGRLFEQIARLKESYKMPVLIVEGDKADFRFKRNVIIGAVVSACIDHGVSILFSDDALDTAKVIEHMAKHESDNSVRAPSMKGRARAFSKSQFQEYVVANLPGIGPKLSKSLLTHFRTIRKMANASVDDLMEVEKVGPKKAAEIHNVINTIYESDA